MTHRARLARRSTIGALVCTLVSAALTYPVAPVPAAEAAAAAVSRASAKVEVALTARATERLLSGDNRVEARGGARRTRVGKQLHLVLAYRKPGAHRGVKALAGRIAFTGEGRDVAWRGLQVDFTRRRITSIGTKGNRVGMLQLVNLHGDDGDGPGFDADTALILTERGAGLLNRAVGDESFAVGDLVATAEGLA